MRRSTTTTAEVSSTKLPIAGIDLLAAFFETALQRSGFVVAHAPPLLVFFVGVQQDARVSLH